MKRGSLGEKDTSKNIEMCLEVSIKIASDFGLSAEESPVLT